MQRTRQFKISRHSQPLLRFARHRSDDPRDDEGTRIVYVHAESRLEFLVVGDLNVEGVTSSQQMLAPIQFIEKFLVCDGRRQRHSVPFK
jgi:hypothetical protein